jgi:hypothetical protein
VIYVGGDAIMDILGCTIWAAAEAVPMIPAHTMQQRRNTCIHLSVNLPHLLVPMGETDNVRIIRICRSILTSSPGPANRQDKGMGRVWMCHYPEFSEKKPASFVL